MTIIDKLRDDEKHLLIAPADESALTHYTLEILGEFETNNGVAWRGRLSYDNQTIAFVTNAGDGGGNDYDFLGGQDQLDAFIADALKAYPIDETLDGVSGLETMSMDLFITLIDIATMLRDR